MTALRCGDVRLRLGGVSENGKPSVAVEGDGPLVLRGGNPRTMFRGVPFAFSGSETPFRVRFGWFRGDLAEFAFAPACR
jgi:hypothetical protein